MGKGRKPCCDKSKVKSGAWSPAEDFKLISFIQKYGHDNWRSLPKLAGLARCGKSCRLRWTNYLRPDLKRGNFTKEEEEAIIILHQTLGNKWSKIASNFPDRTDNEIKNLWNTHLKKRATEKQDSAGAAESQDSFATYSPSSSSTTTNHNKRKATETETDDGNDADHRHRRRETDTEKPRVSSEDTEPIISSNSSSSSTNSKTTNSSPAAVISTPAGGDGFEALLFDEFLPPTNFGLAGDIPVEIPFELDVDFWNFLDGLDPFEEQIKNNNNGENGNYSDQSSNLGEIEQKRWLQYIENELGLESTEKIAGEDDSGKSLGVKIPPEVNSEIGYYHLWPSL